MTFAENYVLIVGEEWENQAVEGFVDASGLLGPGVYVLLSRGEVVFVGRASGPMLAKIAAIRSTDRPKFLPRITFDQVLIQRLHPDRIAEVYFDLIAEHQPRHNTSAPMAVPTQRLERRRI